MWCRKRIDIGWLDLAKAFRGTLRPADPVAARHEADVVLFPPDEAIATLSVRSGLDLLLQSLELPPGSEVLMSAVTITDMARIVEEHGLVVVPVCLNPQTMLPDVETLSSAITDRTAAVLVAHLFGAIHDLTPLVRLARGRNLIFIEDCAQAFDGSRYRGHDESDVVMFSFGPIKTATALAGGLLRIRRPELLQKMKSAHAQWPVQPESEFRRRVLGYAVLKLISGRVIFGLLMLLLNLLRRDADATLNAAVRNFPADRFYAMLRRQPCSTLLTLIVRRIQNFDIRRQDRRARLGAWTCAELSQSGGTSPAGDASAAGAAFSCLGASCLRHTWWVMPVIPPAECDRGTLIARLAKGGFDATAASQLKVVSGQSEPGQDLVELQRLIDRLLFLPLYPELSDAAARRMTTILREAVRRSR